MLFFDKRILGVDFGTRSVKMVELKKSGKDLNLVNYSIVSLLMDDSLDYSLGATQLFEENLATILREGKKNFKAKDVVFVFPASFLFSNFFSLPDIPKKSLQGAISYEAKKYLPVSSSEILIKTRISKSQSSSQVNKARFSVFLVGVPDGLINKFKTAAKLAGLCYKGGEPEFFAYESFFKKEIGDYVLLNMDIGYSLLSFFHDGEFVFGKKIKFKFFNLINSVTKILDISVNKAEEFLTEKKFDFSDENQSSDIKNENLSNNSGNELKSVKESIETYFVSLFNEIQDEINIIQEKFGCRIDNAFLCGSIMEIPGLLDSLQKHSGKLKITILDSFKQLQNVPNNNIVLNKSPIFGGAIGACAKFLKMNFR